jgi:hypothetical protein
VTFVHPVAPHVVGIFDLAVHIALQNRLPIRDFAAATLANLASLS